MENGVSHALCLVYVDDFMLACSDSPFGKHVFQSVHNLYEWGKWESRVFDRCGAQITQAYYKHTGTWCGFEISFTEYVEEISIITLPSHRRRDKKSKITPLELFQTSSLEWSVALVGYAIQNCSVVVVGQTPQATVDTINAVNKLACCMEHTLSHRHDDFFPPFPSGLCRAQNSICMCHGSGAISSLFLLVILRVVTVEIHGWRASIASAPTTAGLGTGSDGTAECASRPRACVGRSLDQDYTAGSRSSSRVDDLVQPLDRWWILVYLEGQTSGTAARRHGPTGVS